MLSAEETLEAERRALAVLVWVLAINGQYRAPAAAGAVAAGTAPPGFDQAP